MDQDELLYKKKYLKYKAKYEMLRGGADEVAGAAEVAEVAVHEILLPNSESHGWEVLMGQKGKGQEILQTGENPATLFTCDDKLKQILPLINVDLVVGIGSLHRIYQDYGIVFPDEVQHNLPLKFKEFGTDENKFDTLDICKKKLNSLSSDNIFYKSRVPYASKLITELVKQSLSNNLLTTIGKILSLKNDTQVAIIRNVKSQSETPIKPSWATALAKEKKLTHVIDLGTGKFAVMDASGVEMDNVDIGENWDYTDIGNALKIAIHRNVMNTDQPYVRFKGTIADYLTKYTIFIDQDIHGPHCEIHASGKWRSNGVNDLNKQLELSNVSCEILSGNNEATYEAQGVIDTLSTTLGDKKLKQYSNILVIGVGSGSHQVSLCTTSPFLKDFIKTLDGITIDTNYTPISRTLANTHNLTDNTIVENGEWFKWKSLLTEACRSFAPPRRKF